MNMAQFQLLQNLPEELLQDVISRLSGQDLSSLNLASHWCYNIATPLIWRELNLVDCRIGFEDFEDDVDDHDDTPLLRKLLILVHNPWIASCVQTVTHRCHLPPPAIFHELPNSPLSGQTLSPDPRTTKLIQLAVKHMQKVHTLRIIFGHPNINDALLRCFFDKTRQCTTPIRRLWLESCRISAGCCLRIEDHRLSLPLELDFAGLESVRFRRLPMQTRQPISKQLFGCFNHARGTESSFQFQDGAGGHYLSCANDTNEELLSCVFNQEGFDTSSQKFAKDSSRIFHVLARKMERVHYLDDRIYRRLSKGIELPPEIAELGALSLMERNQLAYRGPWLDPGDLRTVPRDNPILKSQRERLPSADVGLALMQSASATLTSICLDWILVTPELKHNRHAEIPVDCINMFLDFFDLRFPHLRALQFRNAVVREASHPTGLYLLDKVRVPNASEDSPRRALACFEFMEAHSNLQCLSWPMDGFFSGKQLPADIADRVSTVIDNLGRTLVDLRVDVLYSGWGELQSDNFGCQDPEARDRRRRFISHFAPKMTRVESFKIEGGIPRDERREAIRALHASPLKKIVMIGVCSPLGNTWGAEGREVSEVFHHGEGDRLEAEDKDAIYSLGMKEPAPIPADFKFVPSYGWPPGPPMIHHIASTHANTVTELKFCGYKGSPVLFTPTPITNPMLAALKHFHNLETLIMSVWLSTIFEDAPRDTDIIKYWLDIRSPLSVALVRTVRDEGPEGWEKELLTKFAPDALAWQVTSFIGPFLSEQAKARKGGVHVRASVCIGEWGGIFDIDLRIGKGSVGSDVCLEFKGPREELEAERRRMKLERRRWF